MPCAVLLAALLAARLCHLGILWAEETLPLAAACQMHEGRTLYRDIWFDKPPLTPALYWALGVASRPAQPGPQPASSPAPPPAPQPEVALRVAGALYGLLACWLAYRFARDLWTESEGLWAAGLMGFFLIFDFPATAIPLAADLLMLAPHLAAVWLAYRRRPFWSGALAGMAFLISPKALFVLAACALWNPAGAAGAAMLAAGFAALSGAAAVWLWCAAALSAYWDEVWRWGSIYAAAPFADNPLRNGLIRTLDWLGFHAALLVGGGAGLIADMGGRGALLADRNRRPGLPHWLGWLLLSFAAVAAGLRFFPRYYFQLLPVFVLLAARGFTLLGQPRAQGRRYALAALLLLLIPAARFGPPYVTALRSSTLSGAASSNSAWRDTAMDRDSRAAAAIVRQLARPGDTLFVWGYRPEIYVYAPLPAATMFLDSQPLTGVPADRHLTQSAPVETEGARARRAELARSRPTFVLDGLGSYNPHLAITQFADLRSWFNSYREVARSGETVIYQRLPERPQRP